MSDDNQNEDGIDEEILEEQPLPSQEEILEGLPDIPQDISLDEQMSAQARKPGRFKKEEIERFIKFGAIGVGLLLVVLMVYSCQPKKGSMGYGICSTFLELNTTYPHTLNYTDVEFSRTAVRIYFSEIDAFGEYKHQMIECTFGPDEKMGMKLTQVKRNRNAIEAKIVNDFNMTLPTVMSGKPYLVMPPEWKNQLLME